MLSSRPTFANASSANCSSSRVCVAVTMVRTRALSRATVGKRDALREDAFLEQPSDSFIASAPSPTMTGVIGLSLSPVLKPERLQSGLEEPRVLPQPLDDLRLLLEHVERRDARGGDGRRMRRREQKRPRAVIEELDQRAAAGDVAAERADRLRQRADLDVHAAVHAEVIDGAAAVPPEHAAGVRIVHHHDAAEFLGEVAQRRQRAEVAVHAEHAVGDEQLALRRRQLRDDAPRGGDVLVRKHLDRRAAQTAAVDDAGVIQLVGDDDVVFG